MKYFLYGRGFIDFTDTNYSNYLGFVWERELVDLTPIGCDSHGSNVGEVKGSETHSHYTPFGANNSYIWGISIQNEDFPVKHRNSTGYDIFLANGGSLSANHKTIGESATYDESSYQPSKVVAYWKRVE